MVGFQVLQPIAFLGTYICIYHPITVVGKGKEVAFLKKANWFNWANQVYMDQLIWLLCTPLWLPVVHLSYFGLLIVVTDIAIRIIVEKNVEIV